DDTEKTNSEDRPLYTILGQDSNNRSFPHTWCFMPSKAQWAYQWIWGTAVPALHPGSVLSRVMLINCDADPQETRAIESVVGRGKDISAVFPNAWQRWCAWHRIDRKYDNIAMPSKYGVEGVGGDASARLSSVFDCFVASTERGLDATATDKSVSVLLLSASTGAAASDNNVSK
ncbi:hypothetical protein THAOC_34759, partial [Thalassiosira oceanica]